MKRLACVLAVPALVMLACLSQTATAAGFAIIEHGVKGLGNAFAGGAASAEDPTTIYFNPAGMTRLGNKQQIVLAGHIIKPSAKFSDNGSNVGGTPLTGGDGGDAGETAFVPNFYWLRPINDRLTFGLGVNVPYGLETRYDSDWKGRYHAIDSEILTLNINPSLAYKVNDKLSIGFGISAQYADALLSNAINLRLLTPPPNRSTAQDADAIATVKGDDWGYGFNFGLLFEPSQNTRIGIAYRSKIKYKLVGDSEFVATNATASLFLPGFQALQIFVNTGVEARLTMPETISVSFYHQINPKWAIMGDITRTRWSRIQDLQIDYASSQANTVLLFEWQDSNRYAFGVSYRKNDRWTLRGGLALDETPIPSTELRSPRIPGNDRKWLTFGTSYQRSDRFSIDFAYAHLFVSNTPINNTGSVTSGSHVLTGNYDGEVDILSLQLNWVF